MRQGGSVSDKKQQIIETAYRLFRAHGYHAVGIDRIIAEAGVAKMTMYRHFPTKDALIVAALAMRQKRFEAELDAAERAGAGVDKALDAIVDWYRDWFDSPDFHGCAFAHALAEFGDAAHAVHQAAAAQKAAFRQRLEGILRRRFPAPAAGDRAAVLAMLFEGAALQAQIVGPERASDMLRLGVWSIVPPGDAA